MERCAAHVAIRRFSQNIVGLKICNEFILYLPDADNYSTILDVLVSYYYKESTALGSDSLDIIRGLAFFNKWKVEDYEKYFPSIELVKKVPMGLQLTYYLAYCNEPSKYMTKELATFVEKNYADILSDYDRKAIKKVLTKK